MNDPVVVDVATQFSPAPFGRYPSDGPNNGERFRKELLTPSLVNEKSVRVLLDGIKRLPGSSWLEEAFGGLVRTDGFTSEFVKSHLAIETSRRDYVEEIWDYIAKAATVRPAAK
jgi:hypothetical protein